MNEEIKNDENICEDETSTEFESEEEIIVESPVDEKAQKDFYVNLRGKIKAYVEKNPKSKYVNYLVAVPDFFHLLCKLLADNRVPVKEKAKIAAAIAYFVSPLDIISDFIPGVGYLDDVIIAINVVNSLITSVGPEVIEELWAGDKNVWSLIKQLLEFANSVVGLRVFEKIKNWFKGK